MPILFCLKKTGPGLVIFISRIKIKRIGERTTIPNRLIIKSITLFMYFA